MPLPLSLAGCCPLTGSPVVEKKSVKGRMPREINRVSGDSEQARAGEAAVVTDRRDT